MNIKELQLPERCRVIAVSDIHTSCDLLDKMLSQANYKAGEDFLVIVGDIVEHWNNNINSIRYVKKLCDQSDRAICLLGNNDTLCVRMAYSYGFEKFAERFYLKNNAFLQMAKELGYTDVGEENWLEIRKAVVEHYGDLLEFLRDLPVCLETQEYVFVHAGVENRPDWRNTDGNFAVTKPWFLREENPTGKWLVVGHFPTYNYRRSNATDLPIVDEKKKMICIDGGLSIKTACQMNLFIINKEGENYTHSVMWETPFPKRIVAEDFSCEMLPVYVDWSNQDIEILSEENGIYRLHDKLTDVTGYLPKREIYEFDNKLHVYQFMSSFPTVKKGEEISVCAEDKGYYLVITQSGKVGWLPVNIIEK